MSSFSNSFIDVDHQDDQDMTNNKLPVITNTSLEVSFWDALAICEVEGFWYPSRVMASIDALRANFKPKRDDVVVLASSMKTGTTWLMALAYCILSRDKQGDEDDLLTKMNPHLFVPSLVSKLYFDGAPGPPVDQDECRLFSTHMPFSYLPDSITKDNTGCKVVYITRDPKDTLVSLWHFFNKIYRSSSASKNDNNIDPVPLERAVENFCSGVIPYGPYYEHVLEYWEASQKSPDKVMFIKYEDLRRDPKPLVRKLASFLGKPFGEDETEEEKEVEKVIWRSSFDRLKNLDVNKTGGKSHPALVPQLTTDLFFRRGEIGDWRNHLTPEIARRVDDVTRVKFRGTGLYLDDDDSA
ncbi:Cytosolic sulfotransferase 17 [Linum grandiflorum]